MSNCKFDIKEVCIDDVVTLSLPEAISSANARDFQDAIDKVQAAHPGCHINFDAENLRHISSAGLRVFLNLINNQQKQIRIENVSLEVYEVLSMTGFVTLMDVQKKLRNVSVKNCKKIGAGRSSIAYRIDADTIVKAYKPDVPMSMIQSEMDCSKKTFLAGIPTAISFDLVTVDHSTYGVVFELIAAVTVGEMITGHMEMFDEITKKYVSVYKHIHATRLEGFPSVKDKWKGWAEGMRTYYSPEDVEFMMEMIDCVPDRDTLVHCDYHENNVLYQDGELVIIDMGDVSYGHPIFDLAGGSFRAHCSGMPQRKANHGLSPENMVKFWEKVCRYYFDQASDKELQEIREICDAYGFLRSALFPMKHSQISADLRNLHIRDAEENLFARKEWAREQMQKLDQYFT
ncbi:MAG: phosphotransferase [Lachnospiraceae bacterium]|nr:phosphotransferase [Lachnospiraceae bacterium]